MHVGNFQKSSEIFENCQKFHDNLRMLVKLLYEISKNRTYLSIFIAFSSKNAKIKSVYVIFPKISLSEICFRTSEEQKNLEPCLELGNFRS